MIYSILVLVEETFADYPKDFIDFVYKTVAADDDGAEDEHQVCVYFCVCVCVCEDERQAGGSCYCFGAVLGIDGLL